MKTLKETVAKAKTDYYRQARIVLISNLALLTSAHHRIFKAMYAGDGKRPTTEEEMAKPIADVVRDMPNEKLDWAVQQVQRTVDKL